MYKDKRVLAIIPARGGSKTIKNKNIKPLLGKPLIAYSIESAKGSSLIDETVISTDSKEIADVAKKYGGNVPFMRPAELAQDDTPMYPVLQHAVSEMEKKTGKKFDVIVLLDPTAPLRTIEDIDGSIRKLVDEDCDTVVTVTEPHQNPYFNMVELDGEGVMHIVKKPEKPIFRRQDAPKVYHISSGVYAVKRDVLMNENTVFGKKAKVIIIPDERAGHIDSEADFIFVETLMKKFASR